MFLEVNNLCKNFGSNQVLKGVNFGVDKGEVIALLGPSGEGKTTLLRCLNLLEIPSTGTITIDGNLIFDASKDSNLNDKQIMAKRKHFGLVFQSFNLFPQYTVMGNLLLAPSLQGYDKKELEELALRLLTKMGLLDKKDYYPYQLSGGQQQRVAIVRALMMNPDILCFDEPTSALDPSLVGEVAKVIKQLKQFNMTVIIVTHDVNFAKMSAEKIAYVHGGKINCFQETSEFFNKPDTLEAKNYIDSIGL